MLRSTGQCRAVDNSGEGVLLTMAQPHIKVHHVVVAEFLGTLLLVTVVVGSGIMAQRLSTDGAVVLLCNTLATVGGLVALITAFSGISGAQFNPVVTLVDGVVSASNRKSSIHCAAVVASQMVGAIAGAITANAMFGRAAFETSKHIRTGGPIWFAEAVATFGLVLVIFLSVSTGKAAHVPYVVGGYIGAAYFFTSSTSFANPAVTVGRMFSNSYAGIAPRSAPMFIVMQFAGAGVATAAAWLSAGFLASTLSTASCPIIISLFLAPVGAVLVASVEF